MGISSGSFTIEFVRSFFLLIILTLVGLPCSAQGMKPIPKKEAEKKKPRELVDYKKNLSWKDWIDRYASSSPLNAMRKTIPPSLLVSDKQLKQVLSGKTKIKFDKPLFRGEKSFDSYDLSQMERALRFEVYDQIDLQLIDKKIDKERVLKEQDRFKYMLGAIRELIQQRKEGELLIIFTGETHALDLYFTMFLKPDLPKSDPLYRVWTDVLYVSPPYSWNTTFFSADYYKLLEAMRGSKQPVKTVKSSSLHLFSNFPARLYFFSRLKSELFSLEKLTEERNKDFGVLVFMDTHYMNSFQLYKDMPKAATLIDLGIKRITFATEGLQHNKEYESRDFFKLYHVDADDALTKEDQEYYRKFRSKAYAQLKKGVVSNLSARALHLKLKQWESSGIPVTYTGLEEFDRFISAAEKEKRRQQ